MGFAAGTRILRPFTRLLLRTRLPVGVWSRARKPETLALDFRDLDRLVQPRQGLPALTFNKKHLWATGSPKLVQGPKATPVYKLEESDTTFEQQMTDNKHIFLTYKIHHTWFRGWCATVAWYPTVAQIQGKTSQELKNHLNVKVLWVLKCLKILGLKFYHCNILDQHNNIADMHDFRRFNHPPRLIAISTFKANSEQSSNATETRSDILLHLSLLLINSPTLKPLLLLSPSAGRKDSFGRRKINHGSN